MAMLSIKLFLVLCDNKNCQLDRKMNSSPITHFRFLNVVLRNRNQRKKIGNVIKLIWIRTVFIIVTVYKIVLVAGMFG